jgi:hypothetical protein
MSGSRGLIASLVVGWLAFGPGTSSVIGQVTPLPLNVADSATPDGYVVDPGQMPIDPSVPNGVFTPVPESGYAPGWAAAGNGYPVGAVPGLSTSADGDWGWILFPHGWMYPTYLASVRESRMAGEIYNQRKLGAMVDATVGGRAGVMRYGSDDLIKPEGYQLDFEAAAFPRLTLDSRREFESVDFRVGVPLTARYGPVETKLAYYHYCSHLGDMFIEANPGVLRVPYTRDAVTFGLALRPKEDFRIYAEADYAFHTYGSPKPWQFQFGIDWSTLQPTGLRGAPFFAINSMLRQDVDYSGNLTVETGWQWRGQAGQSLRTGFFYFNGRSNQGQFFNNSEEQIGGGMWYDF